MSKIAKQKANQWILKHKDGDVLYVQDAYIAAYNQAMQDFLEKASEYLFDNLPHTLDTTQIVSFIDNFKNYMQDESEN